MRSVNLTETNTLIMIPKEITKIIKVKYKVKTDRHVVTNVAVRCLRR
jgi:hypothetical protein